MSSRLNMLLSLPYVLQLLCLCFARSLFLQRKKRHTINLNHYSRTNYYLWKTEQSNGTYAMDFDRFRILDSFNSLYFCSVQSHSFHFWNEAGQRKNEVCLVRGGGGGKNSLWFISIHFVTLLIYIYSIFAPLAFNNIINCSYHFFPPQNKHSWDFSV